MYYKRDTMHKLHLATKCYKSTKHPLLYCLVSMWFGFQFRGDRPEQHCRCAGSSAAPLNLTVGEGGIFFTSFLLRPFASELDQRKFSSFLSLHWSTSSFFYRFPSDSFDRLSLQIVLESFPICSSSPKALGSRSSGRIVFVTLGSCS
jgi:hypothetical protein